MSKVKCPNCGREHSIFRKDGELREKIHCRCRDWSGEHTLIWWVFGMGYHVSDKNMDLIPALYV